MIQQVRRRLWQIVGTDWSSELTLHLAHKPQSLDDMDIDNIRTAADDDDEDEEDDDAERVDYETFLKILGSDT